MTDTSDRLPPQDLDSEQATLGSMLLETEAADLALAIVEPADFYREAHQLIASAMQTIHQRGEPVDLTTVSAELRRRGQLEKVGGGEYLAALIQEVPTAAHVVRYATVVAECSVLRQAIREASEVQAEGYDRPEDVGAFLSRSGGRFDSLFAARVGSGPEPVQARFEDAVQKLEDRLALPGEISAQRTGIRLLDWLTFGLGSQRFVVPKADSGVGKSTFARQIFLETARQFLRDGSGRVCLFFGLEEDAGLVQAKMFAYLGYLDSVLLTVPGRWRHLEATDEKAFNQAERQKMAGMSEYAALPLYTDYAHSDIGYIEGHIRRLRRQVEIGLVVIDYFQRLTGGERGERNEEALYRHRAERLGTLANALEIPFIVPSQVTYDPNLKRYNEKGARAIKDVASMVLRFERESDKETEELLDSGFVSCEKSRGTLTFGRVHVHADMARGRIWDAKEWQEMVEAEAQARPQHDND